MVPISPNEHHDTHLRSCFPRLPLIKLALFLIYRIIGDWATFIGTRNPKNKLERASIVSYCILFWESKICYSSLEKVQTLTLTQTWWKLKEKTVWMIKQTLFCKMYSFYIFHSIHKQCVLWKNRALYFIYSTINSP